WIVRVERLVRIVVHARGRRADRLRRCLWSILRWAVRSNARLMLRSGAAVAAVSVGPVAVCPIAPHCRGIGRIVAVMVGDFRELPVEVPRAAIGRAVVVERPMHVNPGELVEALRLEPRIAVGAVGTNADGG